MSYSNLEKQQLGEIPAFILKEPHKIKHPHVSFPLQLKLLAFQKIFQK